MGFLTGEENREMEEAHYTGVMIVGEPFRTSHPDELYDFASAGFTEKITKLLPTMSKHRLTPPPPEIYSLHKKVVGTYLMCIKLGAKVPARRIFEDTYENWRRLHNNEPLKERLDSGCYIGDGVAIERCTILLVYQHLRSSHNQSQHINQSHFPLLRHG